MVIKFGNENLLTLAQVARLLPGHPHVATIFRWCRYGCRNIRLEYVRMGRRMLTSKEALERFSAALAALDADEDNARAEARECHDRDTEPKNRSVKQRAKAIERAEVECAKAGL